MLGVQNSQFRSPPQYSSTDSLAQPNNRQNNHEMHRTFSSVGPGSQAQNYPNVNRRQAHNIAGNNASQFPGYGFNVSPVINPEAAFLSNFGAESLHESETIFLSKLVNSLSQGVELKSLNSILDYRLNFLVERGRPNQEVLSLIYAIDVLINKPRVGRDGFVNNDTFPELKNRFNSLNSENKSRKNDLKKALRRNVDSVIFRLNISALNEKSDVPRDTLVKRVNKTLNDKKAHRYRSWMKKLKASQVQGEESVKNGCKTKFKRLFRSLSSFFCESDKCYETRQKVAAKLQQDHEDWRLPLHILSKQENVRPEEMKNFLKSSQKAQDWYEQSCSETRNSASRAIGNINLAYSDVINRLNNLSNNLSAEPRNYKEFDKFKSELGRSIKSLKNKDFLGKKSESHAINELSELHSSLENMRRPISSEEINKLVQLCANRYSAYNVLSEKLQSKENYWDLMLNAEDTFYKLGRSQPEDIYSRAYQNWRVLTDLMNGLSKKF
ncbi:Uncharacterized protein MCB1EB_0340 [Mycoavidus cysteinexigens]|uniref:Uncharacterized protein n=1 Tax=Mycoavidus cysteinexigens TaxID=1553431 RepID=A0A2Z6ESY0_9BURK|nr:hypothetical protein [Mycoavidus cysteinexigens]BBE08501.1 Uncharacterized protein MCB1EB_0340 [Mycoavidus cysteinexigens]GAM52795.1 hypothetical protein EBME_1258 [bacterium endosymbiont of Mortierella elongata FMR23-6]GLR01384.1 hypothetical protein GCM10007934_11960 [Mycoavidus cysteinexigens]